MKRYLVYAFVAGVLSGSLFTALAFKIYSSRGIVMPGEIAEQLLSGAEIGSIYGIEVRDVGKADCYRIGTSSDFLTVASYRIPYFEITADGHPVAMLDLNSPCQGGRFFVYPHKKLGDIYRTTIHGVKFNAMKWAGE